MLYRELRVIRTDSLEHRNSRAQGVQQCLEVCCKPQICCTPVSWFPIGLHDVQLHIAPVGEALWAKQHAWTYWSWRHRFQKAGCLDWTNSLKPSWSTRIHLEHDCGAGQLHQGHQPYIRDYLSSRKASWPAWHNIIVDLLGMRKETEVNKIRGNCTKSRPPSCNWQELPWICLSRYSSTGLTCGNWSSLPCRLDFGGAAFEIRWSVLLTAFCDPRVGCGSGLRTFLDPAEWMEWISRPDVFHRLRNDRAEKNNPKIIHGSELCNLCCRLGPFWLLSGVQ